MSNPNDYQNMNKYQVYRKIRSDRAYRTLGKMTLLRVVAGVLLLVLVFLLSGAVSQYFAVRGHFKTAELLMISPGWMEKYKPEQKAYIEAGVLYQEGNFEGAYSAFDAIEDLDAATAMREVCSLNLALASLESGDYDSAYERAAAIDSSVLPEAELEQYRDMCSELLAHYEGSSAGDSAQRAEFLKNAAAEQSA